MAATRAGDRLYVPLGGDGKSYFALLSPELPGAGASSADGAGPDGGKELPAHAGLVRAGELPDIAGERAVFGPAAAKRSTTSVMCGTSPHHSWMTSTPGPLPARYPSHV